MHFSSLVSHSKLFHTASHIHTAILGYIVLQVTLCFFSITHIPTLIDCSRGNVRFSVMLKDTLTCGPGKLGIEPRKSSHQSCVRVYTCFSITMRSKEWRANYTCVFWGSSGRPHMLKGFLMDKTWFHDWGFNWIMVGFMLKRLGLGV